MRQSDESLLLLKPVIVPDLLEDIPGGEPNLLPVRAVRRPLLVSVPKWLISDPSEEEPETLELQWDDQFLDSRCWTVPVREEDLDFEVPVEKLVEGRHSLTYRVTLGNEGTEASEPLTLYIDKTAPALGGQRGRLEIVEDAEQIERDGLTARYLERHQDRLRTRVPDYETPMPGDIITWYWGASADDSERVDSRTLNVDDIAQPLFIDFQGQMIRERQDGQRYAYYEIEDRAGNLSAQARSLEMGVNAQPIPRDLGWVEIPQATGAGPDLTLSMNAFVEPLLVEIPETARLFPDETVTVTWGDPGDYGYFSTAEPQPGTERHFLIPVKSLLAYSRQTVVVGYHVFDGVDTFPSAARNLAVSPLSEHLPQVQLQGADGNGFSLGPAPALVPVRLGIWSWMAAGQQVRITITGVLQSGGDAQPYPVLEAHVVTPGEVSQGIGMNDSVTVPKTYLAQLRRNHTFTLHVGVSFDAGKTWVDFPTYSPMLKA
ncbi:hypothetical protein [Pseudomonas sp. HLMP]|uniref:hypothetical protein n=1 Tax=Pseudomonas sp. HLMP TaxID=3153767 RepID=UPI003967CE5B